MKKIEETKKKIEEDGKRTEKVMMKMKLHIADIVNDQKTTQLKMKNIKRPLNMHFELLLY